MNLAECLSNYFASSEQLPTRFWLNANGRRARGLLLQQLPADRLKDPEAREASWQHLTTLADTLTAEELLALDNETVLHRLYHEETVRLFEPQPLVFHCSCSRERSANALVSLGQADCERLLEEEEGSITIDCQFCNQRYLFDASDVAQLFAGAGSQGLPRPATDDFSSSGLFWHNPATFSCSEFFEALRSLEDSASGRRGTT